MLVTYISLGYSMHSRIPKQKDRYLYCMHEYTHFPSDEKYPNFFYGPTQNNIGKGSVKCNATPACSSLLY